MNPRTLPTLLALVLASSPLASPAQSSADEQYRFLAGLVDKGLHELAVEEAGAFLRAHPKHEKAPLARYRLAGALWELGRRDEAGREYDALVRLERFEYRAECLFRSGECALARSDDAHARSAFEGVLAAGQDYLVAPALFALAEAHFRAQRFAEAEPRYVELLRVQPTSAEAPLARRALVWCAWERGDVAETALRARDSLRGERDPERRDELLLLLGEALLASDAKAALEAFRALATPAQAAARLRGEGFALAALGDRAGAARAFETLLAQAPDGPFAREAALQAGIARLQVGDASAAVQRLGPLARDGEPETLYWLAQAQKQTGEPKAALDSLARALRARPAAELEERIHVLRGDCFVAEGRALEAQAAYEKSGSAQALHAGAVAALQGGDADGAARLAQRLLAAGPEDSRAQAARVVLAEAHFAAQRYAEAERAFEAARVRPSDGAEEARLAARLAWCRYLAGDLAAAEQRFAALLERHASSPEAEEALALLVRIAGEQGSPVAARAPATRYLERFPRGRFADQALLALARAAEGAEARKRLDEWLARFPENPLQPAVQLELAELELAAGAHANAARRYARVLELAPEANEAARAAYGSAWCAWEQRDLAACLRALAPLVRAQDTGTQHTDTDLRQAALELALSVQLEQGELEAAVASWRALDALKGDEPRRLASARRVLAGLRSARRFDAAAALLEECLGSLATPALAAEARLEVAYLALEREDPGAAEAAIARARAAGASEAGLAEASYHVGEAWLAAHEVPRALALFQSAAAGAHPRVADALYKLGFAHLARGELDQADQALAALLERHPESELAREARFLRGECCFRRGRFEPAAALFAEALDGASGELRARALFRAGLALGELARWSECGATLAELARAFPQFPNLAEAELWRGRALLAQANGRAARAAFERTLALDQGDLAAGAHLGLGQVHESEGRLDEALSEYLKVALLYAHEDSVAEAQLSAGRVLEAQGEAEKAKARYRELADEHAESRFAARARERLRALGGAQTGGEH